METESCQQPQGITAHFDITELTVVAAGFNYKFATLWFQRQLWKNG